MSRERSSAVIPGEVEGTLTASLLDFKPTGFSEASWEICGGEGADGLQEPVFEPMRVNVVSNGANVDPFFEEFRPDEGIVGGASFIRHSAKILADTMSFVDEAAFAEKMREQDLRAEFQKGLRDGEARGRAAMEEECAARIEQMKEQCSELHSSIHHEVISALARMEKGALEFALGAARKILQITAEVHPEYIVEIIRRGLGNLGAATPISIRLSEQDYEFVQVVGLPQDLLEGELGITYVADQSIKAGCVIETDFGEVDMELERMWNELRDSLYELCK